MTHVFLRNGSTRYTPETEGSWGCTTDSVSAAAFASVVGVSDVELGVASGAPEEGGGSLAWDGDVVVFP